MKTRNEIYGGTFSSPEAPDTNANGELKKLVLSDSADITKNRSSWIRTIFYNIIDSFTHKTEDRATGTNIGVNGTGIESTETVFVTPSQLPEVDKTTNDFSTPVKADVNGALTTTNDLFAVTTLSTDRKNKRFVVNFSEAGVLFFKARTWLQSELVALINSTIYGSGTTSGLIPVGTIWDYCGLDDPDGFINLCLTGSVRSISKASGAGTLKNDNYQNLFIKLYLSYADIRCPVSGGRSGADSTAALNDFVSGKAISLPDYRGKVGGYYKVGDPNFEEIGKPIGAEIIPKEALPKDSPWEALDLGHSHTYNDMRYNNGTVGENAGGGENARVDENFSTPSTSGNANIEMQPNVGGGQKHFQPTIIQTAIIKY
jgi:hypothetical protein